MSPKSFRVSRESPLLPFLLEACRSCSRTTVKSYLSHNQVEVNGRIVARFDHALSPGDEVAVFPGRRVEPLRHPMLRIVYEDEWLIVGRQAERLAVGRYAARTDPYGLLYPERARQAERPGQPDIRRPPAGPRPRRACWCSPKASGSSRLCRGHGAKRSVAALTWPSWRARSTRRSGTVSTYLAESKGYKVFVTKDRSAGERAVTRYRVLRFRDGFSLVELELETGKKNQIRAHMEYIGHPVAGDHKYGAHGDPAGRVALPCEQALFRASGDGARARFFVAVPAAFGRIVK